MANRHPLAISAAVLLATAISLASGCARIKVSQENTSGADLSTIRTYVWDASSARLPKDTRIDASALDRQLRDALDGALAANGFAKARPGEAPDTRLTYRISIRKKSTETAINETAGYSTGWTAYRDDEGYREIDSGGTYLEEWEQGRLEVELWSPDGRAMLWRGTAKTEIHFENPPSERERRLRTAASKLVGQLGQRR
jgi:hypothetical protein